MKRLFLLLTIFCHVFDRVKSHSEHSLLLLVSLDGFRWDYLQKVKDANLNTPNFDSLISSGAIVAEPGLTNVFPTQTFVNHYTMVTGLYPEEHGVVSGYMFDPSINETYSYEKKSDNLNAFWFNNGTTEEGDKYRGPQPIWNTNQKYGSGISQKRSGVMFWPGSEAAIGGDHPEHCEHYNSSLSYQKRIDMVVGWFATEDKPINLGLLYFEEPDNTGHDYGPDSSQVIAKIVELDKLMGHLVQQLKAAHLFDKINIMVTSDHGMTTLKHTIVLSEYIESSMYKQFGESPVWLILPAPGNESYVYEALEGIPHLRVYNKTDLPREYHYSYNKRILPIVIEAEEGYRLCLTNDTSCEALSYAGDHGYNNSLPSMHPFFIAHGPAFKKQFVAEPFHSVDLVPLMCHILDIPTPENIDGSLERAKHILFVDDMLHFVTTVTVLASVSLAAIISIFCLVAVCRLFNRMHRRIRHLNILIPLSQTTSEGAKPLLDSDEFD